MTGTPLKDLVVLKDLCSDENLKNIVLVTTMWGELQVESIGSEREEELLSTSWKDIINVGSRTCRFQGTRESAWEIIDRLDLKGRFRARSSLPRLRKMGDLRDSAPLVDAGIGGEGT